MDKLLLTIQDVSCVGQCSITIAHPILCACGIETAILPGAVLSNHTAKGYSGWTFKDLTDEFPLICERWQKEKIYFDVFYTGYVTETQIPHIIEIMKKNARPNALKIVDPAMADYGKLYAGFDENFPEVMAKLCEGADVILPNITEACLLAKKEYKDFGYDKEYIEDLCKSLFNLNVKNVVITGVSFEKDKVGAAIYDGKNVRYTFAQKQPQSYHGTGDAYSAVVVAGLCRGISLEESTQIAADFIVECIKKTVDDKEHWYGVKFEKAIPWLLKRFGEL